MDPNIHTATAEHDLILLVDATYSMEHFLRSLRTSLPQIISLSALTDCFSRIGLLAYRDYSDLESIRIEWSGWYDESQPAETRPDLEKLAKNLEPRGGGDFPEALKTALAKACQEMRAEATTIILLFADAPPHMPENAETKANGSNYHHERDALSNVKSFGGNGPEFLDLVKAARTLSTGPKKAQIFSIVSKEMHVKDFSYFVYLSAVTNGCCLRVDSWPLNISKTTVELLLAWMSVEKTEVKDQDEKLPATICRYEHLEGITDLINENDSHVAKFFAFPGKTTGLRFLGNIRERDISIEAFKKLVVKKQEPVLNFAEKYKKDPAYRQIATRCLSSIIQDNVVSISLNPVFGSLWRAVCNDRDGEHRQELITSFGLAVDRLRDPSEKTRMKTWLEESYDYTGEVLEIINSVPQTSRYPCVCLDPTLVFAVPRDNNENEEDDKDNEEITAFRRDELLEIGRSCDYRILKRLGKVLTRLTFIESAESLPEHIAHTTDKEVPKIPLILASKTYGFQFWRILLHIVVPGTFLGARASALLAALCIRMGVQPLMSIAVKEVLSQRKRWNDLEVPENWNASCLSHLLDADKVHRKMLIDPSNEQKLTLLRDEDKRLFEKVVAYKMLERNVNTTLTAVLGWTPEKASLSIGPLATCKCCEYPRSVTVMGEQAKCGLCLSEYSSAEEEKEWIHARVSRQDTSATEATWVECNVQTCRSQYVVYQPSRLRVRPKCHYCRTGTGPAPWIECKSCSNRMIWPLEYRSAEMKAPDAPEFRCIACSSGRKTLVDVEVVANELIVENGTAWLLRNENSPAGQTTDQEAKEAAFGNRSLYHTIKTLTPAYFADLTLFPTASPPHSAWPLFYKGKPISNSTALIESLKSWVLSNRIQSATCTLCFSNFRKDQLIAACGRRGCLQRVDAGCLNSFYGINRAGSILNLAALNCPFCRRLASPKTIVAWGGGVHAVGGLTDAMAHRGEWVYAWCEGCARAKQFAERVCLGNAEAPRVEHWRCEDCAAGSGDGSIKVRDCPGCRVTTERMSGCGHMQCTNCNTHWCWFCGKIPEGNIYDHMGREHGGAYGAEEPEYSDGGYDTDYDDGE